MNIGMAFPGIHHGHDLQPPCNVMGMVLLLQLVITVLYLMENNLYVRYRRQSCTDILNIQITPIYPLERTKLGRPACLVQQ